MTAVNGVFLHSIPYPHGDASPVVLIAYMAGGAAIGLAVAFWRELGAIARRLLGRASSGTKP